MTEVSLIPFPGFERLRLESLQEGYHFLDRLQQEWVQGNNRFDKEGEGLFSIWIGSILAGIGGINIDPFLQNPSIGRLRRFYIASRWRRQGLGKRLLEHILLQAQPQFHEVVLFTDHLAAANFYESMGFISIKHTPKISHKGVIEEILK